MTISEVQTLWGIWQATYFAHAFGDGLNSKCDTAVDRKAILHFAVLKTYYPNGRLKDI